MLLYTHAHTERQFEALFASDYASFVAWRGAPLYLMAFVGARFNDPLDGFQRVYINVI